MKAVLSLREHQKRAQEIGQLDTFLTEAVIREAERIAWGSPDLSYRNLRRYCMESYRKLGEATPGAAFAQLFRAGAQVQANTWYDRTAVTYESYTAPMTSSNRQEYYPPLYGSQFPDEVLPGEPYTENKLQGLDIELKNKKFMGGESFERELFDDDQTGQINQRMRHLGESARQREELEVAARVMGNAALTRGNVTVPASVYNRLNADGNNVGVYADNFYGVLDGVIYGNKLATFAQLSMNALRTALEGLALAFDPLGVPIAVMPDTLVHSAFDKVNALTILNSTYYPGVPGLSGQTASGATSGSPTGVAADNILKGMLNPYLNIYLKRGAWSVGEAKKGLVFQRRDPLEVVQEVPNSGASFNQDVIRYRSRSRWVTDWIDSSFWFQGNDGSASLAQ